MSDSALLCISASRLSHLQGKEKVAERAGVLSTVALQGGVVGTALRQVRGIGKARAISCMDICNIQLLNTLTIAPSAK